MKLTMVIVPTNVQRFRTFPEEFGLTLHNYTNGNTLKYQRCGVSSKTKICGLS